MKPTTWVQNILLALLLAGCGDGGGPGPNPDPDPDPDPQPEEKSEWDEILDSREVDYGQALRIASLKLTGELPTLTEIKFLEGASDQKAAYVSLVNSYLDDVRFAGEVRDFFRDSFRMGGGDLDTAPNFAAQLVVEERPFTELFTAATDTCPTFDRATGLFTPASCNSGAPADAGVLTNPHVMRHFFSNMAFRRVRWVQETFVCTKFPAEVGQPVDVGGAAQYTSPWPFTSVASIETGGTIDFRDVSAVVCANCHTTMNHQAPLFAHFDEDGTWQQDYAVPTPAEGAPTVTLADYLPDGEELAYRFGQPIADLPDLGRALAADPDVAECLVARTWNWAMGKGDIVAALALVPDEVIQQQIDLFKSSNYNLKEVIRAVFTSDDFVKF